MQADDARFASGMVDARRLFAQFKVISGQMFAVVDAQGRYIQVEQSDFADFPYTAEELLGHYFGEFLHPDDLETSQEVHKTLLAGEPLVGFTNRYRTKDAGWCWLRWHATLQDGLIYAVAQNVTEEMQAQEALEHKNRMVNSISMMQSHFIKESPVHRVFEPALKALIELTGSTCGFIAEIFQEQKIEAIHTLALSRIAFQEPLPSSVYGDDARGYTLHGMRRLITRLQRVRGMWVLDDIRKECPRLGLPEMRPLLKKMMLIPLCAGDEVIGVVGLANAKCGYKQIVLEDIRPLVASTSQILAAHRERRWREKAQFQLVQAKNQAEAANQAKDMFLANMSHELRTPLNGVLGMAELLSFGVLNEKQRDYVESILEAGNSLHSLLGDILDFARIESGQMTLQPRYFPVQPMLEEVMGLFSVSVAKKDVRLQMLLDDALPQHILADESRVKQIIENYVSNAVKFSAQGNIILRVSSHPLPHQRAVLRFEVQDEGKGIEAAALPMVFDRFMQGENSYTKHYEGAGLGLAICKQLAALMGARVGVYSQLGKGSTFWLEMSCPVIEEMDEKRYA